ncbi:hypothetical protein B7494_g8139 [Chlorociboria aeruginascens]|nr:hypothetical protein B7494_g8139 [Chlorociboria aeruginascens]
MANDEDSSFASQGSSTSLTAYEIEACNAISTKFGSLLSNSKADYCCGGTIPVVDASQPGARVRFDTSQGPVTAPPVVLRFDTDVTIKKIEFPLSGGKDGEVTEGNIEALLSACAPASFGLEGKDVLNDTYRKAAKLDRNQFSVDFHPHDYGVVDAIAQSLLPSVYKALSSEQLKANRVEHWGVVAELYKLNIYSGPSGKFKKHVDTPRGAAQFGSLVVCLPYSHEGGQLVVEHNGHKSVFDWSIPSTDIKWAAFYSDCEHEVLPVTSGHRITLTYNLYISEYIGGIMQEEFPTADPASYPLFEVAKELLAKKAFMTKGGTMGFYCQYRYAHTTKSQGSDRFPYALKGQDAAIYMVFEALGLNLHLRPVLHQDEGAYDYLDGEASSISRIGKRLHPIEIGGEVEELDSSAWADLLQHTWPMDEREDITWLNGLPDNYVWDIALMNIVYGNQAELDWHYSYAAILVDVPSYDERAKLDIEDESKEGKAVEEGTHDS